MPFDDDEAPPLKGKGTKLNNKQSSVPAPKPNQAEVFSEKATMVFNKLEDFKNRAWDLSAKFSAFVESKILPENRTTISKELENEVLNNLILLANEMNVDEDQPEAIGGVVLSKILMRCMLIQRDTISTLAYKIDKLEKQLIEVKSNVEHTAHKQ